MTVTFCASGRGQQADAQGNVYKPLVSKSAGTAAEAAGDGYIPALSEVRKSNRGLFNVSVKSEPDPAVIHQFLLWTLHVETADGKPVDNAVIQTGGGMPAHDHDMPTAPEITRYLGNGDYLIEGMSFHMPGLWQVMFYINAGDISDTAVFELLLE